MRGIRISDAISMLALVASIFSIWFSWHNSEVDKRINTTIDISRKYLEEDDVLKARLNILGIFKRVATGGGVSALDPDSIILDHIFGRIDYILYLSKTNNISRDHIARTIACDIELVHHFTKRYNFRLSSLDNVKNFSIEQVGLEQPCERNIRLAPELGINISG